MFGDKAPDPLAEQPEDQLAQNDPESAGQTEVFEWHGPVMAKTDSSMTLPWILADRVERTPHGTLIEVRNSLGRGWRRVSAKDFAADVMSTARGLVGLGLQPGDSVGIMAHTSYEWTLLDFAAWSAGLVPVPIYETSSSEQISWIVSDANVRMVITENATMRRLVRASVEKDQLIDVLALDDSGIVRIKEAGREVAQAVVEERSAALNTDSLATIIYTSGTTGRPKGAELTHGNFTILAMNGHEWMPDVAKGRDSRLLLFLPLAHVYARFLQIFQISGGGVLGHTPNVKSLLDDLASFRPSYLLAVPRVLEKIYNSAEAQAAASGTKSRIFRWAVRTAIAYSQALDTEEGPSKTLVSQHLLADRLLYSKIRHLLGGNVKMVISGGGPLGLRLGHFYRGAGLQVLEGYGLTECLIASVNTTRLSKIGTIGPPISTVAFKISDEGEILIKGPSVMRAYRNNDKANEEAFTEDGWFRTGDIGSLDVDGYVRITGRAKELIVTAGGKNVAPAVLEDPLRGHPLISQVVVVGDKRPFIAALITLDSEMLPMWLQNHGLPNMDVAQAARHPEVLEALDRAVDRANAQVSRAESIRKIKVLVTDFTEDNGLLTPSMKVKRPNVLATFKAEIDEIYGGPVERGH
ncbi:long-chain fatty acid--CoA ligase [Boudabousia liubingyangii]|uniref:Long-chain fatty acid--CoA ligase n=1 Tax=Boudabousia liubingyangii TaxID=1921764 RepID=A0A1Q5PMU8_9ACTO|nr:long-chain fatty acid--CoA ligase [Boudabousia liubingyangii]OKL47459.1 long-chain fatty acid--CoA ligase [Boudabousia liubingyangii]OKL48881.1 long-chain fatty acid--CoA ligase [Boudabousia liubingyangii]